MPGILGLISNKNEEKLFDKMCQKLNHYDYQIEKFLSQEELSMFLNLSDIVINIPKTDQFSVSLMETMASHTIPIISKLKVYEDILVNEENALILNKTNKSKLSKKILYVIDNYEKLSKKIINNNNKLVLDKYNFQTQIEKIIDLYM